MLLSKVVFGAVLVFLFLKPTNSGWIEGRTPTAAAMYIACDGMLSGFRLVETDAIICSLEMSSAQREKLILKDTRNCAPANLTANMKAYAYVVGYLRLVSERGEMAFASRPWTEIAEIAWKKKWPCLY